MNELQVLELQMEQLSNEISEMRKQRDDLSRKFRRRMRVVFDSGEYDAKNGDYEARLLKSQLVKLSKQIEAKGWALKALGEQHENLTVNN